MRSPGSRNRQHSTPPVARPASSELTAHAAAPKHALRACSRRGPQRDFSVHPPLTSAQQKKAPCAADDARPARRPRNFSAAMMLASKNHTDPGTHATRQQRHWRLGAAHRALWQPVRASARKRLSHSLSTCCALQTAPNARAKLNGKLNRYSAGHRRTRCAAGTPHTRLRQRQGTALCGRGAPPARGARCAHSALAPLLAELRVSSSQGSWS